MKVALVIAIGVAAFMALTGAIVVAAPYIAALILIIVIGWLLSLGDRD